MAKWRGEKLDRGSQVIVIVYLDDEVCGHLTFWKEQEELADEWIQTISLNNQRMIERMERS